jgi:ABC-type phosphate transport system substrate-binding protein
MGRLAVFLICLTFVRAPCSGSFTSSATAAGLAAGEQPKAVAVVVHPRISVDNLSMADLRKVMLGDRQYWTPSLRVTLLIRAPVARERDVVLKKIYRMTEAQYRQYWIAKVFRAEAPSSPKVVYSNQSATEIVAALPGAISFVDATQVPKGLKVLKIDGHLPDDKEYPLQ